MYKMKDIHMHIIPDVDDGAWNQEMAETMLYAAYFQGIEKVIATPHSSAFLYQADREKVGPNFAALKAWAEERLPGFQLYQGCEVYCSEFGMEEVIKALNTGVIPTMNGTRYVLAEFSTGVSTKEVFYCVGKLIENQYIPIIAHVERCKYLFVENASAEVDLGYLRQLKDMGCLLQINVYSVYDETNDSIKRNANSLLKEKMVDFLGSDAHRTFHRPPSVESGLKFMYENYEKEYIDKIAWENADILNL